MVKSSRTPGSCLARLASPVAGLSEVLCDPVARSLPVQLLLSSAGFLESQRARNAPRGTFPPFSELATRYGRRGMMVGTAAGARHCPWPQGLWQGDACIVFSPANRAATGLSEHGQSPRGTRRQTSTRGSLRLLPAEQRGLPLIREIGHRTACRSDQI